MLQPTTGNGRYWLDQEAASDPQQGLTVGGGARYMGPRQTSNPDDTTRDFPGFALVDATVSYAKNSWSVQLNARSVLDEFYLYDDCQKPGFGNFVGTPANVVLTVRRDF